jgi:tRNA-splicing ligase RtcB
MNLNRWQQIAPDTWRLAPQGTMRVPAIVYADRALLEGMEDKVEQQLVNVASLPGIVQAAYAMPDAHWGYGFPIGGVAAFDAAVGGIISAGGVGYDISCGVRLITTGLRGDDIEPKKQDLADRLSRDIPAGVGSHGAVRLTAEETDNMLRNGAQWAVRLGFGEPADLERTEEHGRMEGADPHAVSAQAKHRQRDEMGTLGSGNHYLEVQRVAAVVNAKLAAQYRLQAGDIVVSIHCGSRGLGHQIGSEFLQEMAQAAPAHGITLPDRELACAPIRSALGQRYLGAMRAGINCALANRQVLTHLLRQTFSHLFPEAHLRVFYDVSHNTCKEERHRIDGEEKTLFVHRKGATRAFGPHHAEVPAAFQEVGQPVIIGGTMGTASWILAGAATSESRAFSSACHGAGRTMSRHQATKQWSGRQLVDELRAQGVIIRSPSLRGIAEEAPGAYKDVDAVAEAAEVAGLANKVARLVPVVCIKG